MKQICKRLSAIFLALTLVSGSVLTNEIVANANVYGNVLFSDDFSDADYVTRESNAKNAGAMGENGWSELSNREGNFVKSDGTESYTTRLGFKAAIGTGDKEGSKQWENYSVEAELTFLNESGVTGATAAGVSGRLTSADTMQGYVLVIHQESPTDSVAELRLQYGDQTLDSENNLNFAMGEKVVLRLAFVNNKIYGYVNEQRFIDYTVPENSGNNTKGYAGLHKTTSEGARVKFDNYVVTEIKPKNYDDGYLYLNNFDTDKSLADLADEGIITDSTDGEKTKISGGYLFLEKGKKAYLANVVGSAGWENYSVESEVEIVSGEPNSTGYAGIIARSNNTNEDFYEYRIQYKSNGKAYLQLYKRNGEVSTALFSEAYPLSDFTLNTPYKLTMDVYNDGNNTEIMCWVTDCSKSLQEQTKELVFDVVDEKSESNTPCLKGYAGVRSSGGKLTNKYNSFVVKAYQPPTITYPEGYLYCNDFESKMRLTNEGWSSNVGTKVQEEENGVYVLDKGKNNYLTGVAGSAGWTDYVVEADVMINDSGTFPQYAAIVGRSTDKSNTGYELRLIRQDDGDVIRLFKKGASSGKINGVINMTNITLEQGKMNALKMVFSGADIYCYLNGEIVFEVTDDENPYSAGYAGVISQGGTASSTYDNFVVREIQATDFPADAVYPEGYLYYNDFSALRALSNEGWNLSGTKQNGAYVLDEGTRNYLTKIAGSTEWTDYVVETDVVLHDSGTHPQYTAITARSKNLNSEGYELRLYTEEETGDTVVRLFKCGASSGRINEKIYMTNVSVIPNAVHSLKMVVQGATIICYFDGVKMFEVTDESAPYMTGYAGVRSAGGTAKSSFDYFAVREIGADDIVKNPVINQKDGDIWFYDNFKGEESMTDRGWSTDKVALYNGSALVKGKVIVDEVQGSDKWTDYEVSAIVFLDKEAGMYEETSSGVAAICARTTSSGAGYEFGISASDTSNSYLRLYDRKNGVTLATNEKIPVTTGEHTLRMVCIGKEIYCFFDETLAITAQSDAAANGYAGMRASSYNAYYKEFTVRKARPIATILQSGSPNTGDSGMNMAVVYAAAVVCSLSMIGFAVTTYYSRKKYV